MFVSKKTPCEPGNTVLKAPELKIYAMLGFIYSFVPQSTKAWNAVVKRLRSMSVLWIWVLGQVGQKPKIIFTEVLAFS